VTHCPPLPDTGPSPAARPLHDSLDGIRRKRLNHAVCTTHCPGDSLYVHWTNKKPTARVRVCTRDAEHLRDVPRLLSVLATRISVNAARARSVR